MYKEHCLLHELDFLPYEGASRDKLLNVHSARLSEAFVPGLQRTSWLPELSRLEEPCLKVFLKDLTERTRFISHKES